MDDIKKQLSSVVQHEHFLPILLAITVFIIAGIYAYVQYVAPKLTDTYVPNKEFSTEGSATDTETADLYFFYTLWCPHCKKSKPIWEELKSQVGNNMVNGVKVNFIEVDCDKDSATAEKFKVEGYPTIKMVRGNQIIEYDAKPSLDTLNQFLQTSL
jgi:thiol-disulfide isomerase/thioredoxin